MYHPDNGDRLLMFIFSRNILLDPIYHFRIETLVNSEDEIHWLREFLFYNWLVHLSIIRGNIGFDPDYIVTTTYNHNPHMKFDIAEFCTNPAFQPFDRPRILKQHPGVSHHAAQANKLGNVRQNGCRVRLLSPNLSLNN
jgi:hypothetical protein